MIDLDRTISANFKDGLSGGETYSTYIELFYKGKEMSFSKDELPKMLGREPKVCDVVIKSELASRKHCALILKSDHIGILDRSTNGTYIRVGRADPITVKGSFYPLLGQGHIKLGSQFVENDQEIIYYRIVNRIDNA